MFTDILFSGGRVETVLVTGMLFVLGHLFTGKIARHQSKSRAFSIQSSRLSVLG